MKVINPSVELIKQENNFEHVSKCASICYNSIPKKGDDAVKFYNALISSGHLSMLRHESCYYAVPLFECDIELCHYLNDYQLGENPYIQITDRILPNNIAYVATNGQFMYEHSNFKKSIDKYKIIPEEFKKQCPDLMRYTFLITTQLSTARELNRVSPNNIAERSSRYILEGDKEDFCICKPHWIENNYEVTSHFIINPSKKEISEQEQIYLRICMDSFIKYKELIDLGVPREDARGVLPLDTKTKIIYTYSINEWKHILDLRLFDKTGKAHPNCKVVMNMIKKELENLGYEFNNSK